MNSVQIMGNLTRDPQIRATKTGKAVASFSVAVNRTFVAPTGEQREMTDFVNVVAWGAWAEAVGNQLHKGSRVFVEGRFSSRSYEGQDGQKRYVSEVTANLIAIPISTPRQSGPMQDMGGYSQGGYGQAGGFGGQSQNGYNQSQNGFNQSQSRGNFSQFGSQRTDEDIPF